jgi:hypothetical protein
MIISLQVGGFFFALANVICVAILTWAYLQIKFEPKTLAVTGSARKAIRSDLFTWSGGLTANDPDLIKAYDHLKDSLDKVRAFLIAKGVPEGDIVASSITTSRRFHQEVLQPKPRHPAAAAAAAPAWGLFGGAPPAPAAGKDDDDDEDDDDQKAPVVITTEAVDMYTLSQTISVSSSDVIKVPDVCRDVTSLIKDGVEIDTGPTAFYYTKMSELKINMLADATKDATTRAEQIVNNANGTLGKLVEARMGVMQINPKGSTETSAEGNNDTTALDKEISAVVSVRFEVR